MRRIKITKEDVRTALEHNYDARNNDLTLMVEVLTNKGLPTDIRQLALMTKTNVLESIRRYRCYVVREFPYLAPIKEVQDSRNEMETIMREEVKRFGVNL